MHRLRTWCIPIPPGPMMPRTTLRCSAARAALVVPTATTVAAAHPLLEPHVLDHVTPMGEVEHIVSQGTVRPVLLRHSHHSFPSTRSNAQHPRTCGPGPRRCER